MDLAFDNAPLSCFARAERLDVLERLTQDSRRVTTSAVLDELRNGVEQFPRLADALALPWLEEVRVDSLAELRIFAAYAARLGSGIHDIGEATVCAWAEVHGAMVFTDENATTLIARSRGVAVKRSLALVASGVNRGILTGADAEALIGALVQGGARFPVGQGDFMVWARRHALIVDGM